MVNIYKYVYEHIRHWINIVSEQSQLNEWGWFGNKTKPTQTEPTPVTNVAPQPAAPVAPKAAPTSPPPQEDFAEARRLMVYIQTNEHGAGTIQGSQAFRGQIRELIRLAVVNRENWLGPKVMEFLTQNYSKQWISDSDRTTITATKSKYFP